VTGIGDEEISGSVERQSRGNEHAGCRKGVDAAGGQAGICAAGWLTHDNRHIAAGVHAAHAVIAGIRDVDVAGDIRCNIRRGI
jgi:hypothetical protein